MTAITLPKEVEAKVVPEVVDFIIEFDQWDDWIPDVIYLRDVAEDRRTFVDEIRGRRAQGSITLDHVYSLDILSNGEPKLRAPAIPFAERVLITTAIASHAAPVQAKLFADRLSGFEYRPESTRAVYEWTGDLFGLAYRLNEPGRPSDNTSPLAAATQSTKPPLFSALDDGMYRALDAVGEWLKTSSEDVRSVAWRDVRAFFPSIRRPIMWANLVGCGFPRESTRFLEEVCRACGAAPDQGLPPVDDAWGFLANTYLMPVDQALARSKRLFQRCADEYFLMAGDAADRRAAEQTLAAELAKLEVSLHPSKRADIEIDLAALQPSETIQAAVESFLLSIEIASTAPFQPIKWQVSGRGWPGLLKSVLSAGPGEGPHNQTITLLRAMHFARARDVLVLPEETAGIDERERRYRKALADAAWLPDLLTKRLAEAVAARRTWECHWLLLLLSDLGPRSAAARKTIEGLVSRNDTDSMLRAQATLALAKVADIQEIKPVLNTVAPSGSPMVDRVNMVAMYFAERRAGGEWLSRMNGANEARLMRYLKTKRGGGR